MMAARDFEMEARASAAKRDGAVKRYANGAVAVRGVTIEVGQGERRAWRGLR